MPVIFPGNGGGGGTSDKFHDVGSVSGNFAIDWSLGNFQRVTLTGNAAMTNMSGFLAAKGGVLQIFSGGYTLSYPAMLKFPGDVPPTLTGGGKFDFIPVIYDGTTYGGNYVPGYTPYNPNFDFTDLSGLLVYHDSFFGAGDFTTSSGLISQWNDRSGNSKHLTQATGVLQPAYGAVQLKGKNVVTFTDPNRLNWAALANGYFVNTTRAFTVVAVIRQGAYPGGNYYAPWFNPKDENGHYLDFAAVNVPGTLTDAFVVADGGNSAWVQTGYTPLGQNWNLWIVTYNGTGATTQANFGIEQNGSARSLISALQVGAGGANQSLGGAGTTTLQEVVNFRGDMATFAAVNRVLTFPELIQVRGLVLNRWGTF